MRPIILVIINYIGKKTELLDLNQTQRVLCIAGMHRSGTSLLSNWLANSGLFIGDQLLSGYSDNKKGHFEDLEFLELHRQLFLRNQLHDSGLFVKKLPVFDDVAQQMAQELISKRSAEHLLWGWKEPRSTLYLSQWKALIPDMKVLGISRDVNQVVLSLYRRLSKNKWYITRNPIKKFLWKADIDWQPLKWFNRFLETTNIYNNALVEFKKAFPEDCIIVKLEDFIVNDARLGSILNENFGMNLDFIPLNSIYDSKLMNSGQIIFDKLNKELVHKYYQIQEEMEALAPAIKSYSDKALN